MHAKITQIPDDEPLVVLGLITIAERCFISFASPYFKLVVLLIVYHLGELFGFAPHWGMVNLHEANSF